MALYSLCEANGQSGKVMRLFVMKRGVVPC